MNDRELMQQAWEAEEKANPHTAYNSWCRGWEAARLAQPEPEKSLSQKLREAGYTKRERINVLMEQCGGDDPEPEPVATQYKYIDAHGKDYWTDEPWEGKNVEGVRYLYTAPPRKEWQGLTEEEKLVANQMWRVVDANCFIRAIETMLKEKNSAPD